MAQHDILLFQIKIYFLNMETVVTRTLIVSIISRVFCRFTPRFWVTTPVLEFISKNIVQSPSLSPNPVAEIDFIELQLDLFN